MRPCSTALSDVKAINIVIMQHTSRCAVRRGLSGAGLVSDAAVVQ